MECSRRASLTDGLDRLRQLSPDPDKTSRPFGVGKQDSRKNSESDWNVCLESSRDYLINWGKLLVIFIM